MTFSTKHLILAATLSVTALANSAIASTSLDCETYHRMAEATMKARQNGHTLPTVMALANNNSSIESVIRAAYKVPVVMQGNKQRVVDEFANVVYLECLEAEREMGE